MIQDGTAVERQQQPHRVHPGVDHGRQGEIDEPVFAGKGFGSHGTLPAQFFHVIGPLQIDQADDVVIH